MAPPEAMIDSTPALSELAAALLRDGDDMAAQDVPFNRLYRASLTDPQHRLHFWGRLFHPFPRHCSVACRVCLL